MRRVRINPRLPSKKIVKPAWVKSPTYSNIPEIRPRAWTSLRQEAYVPGFYLMVVKLVDQFICFDFPQRNSSNFCQLVSGDPHSVPKAQERDRFFIRITAISRSAINGQQADDGNSK
jgi:hypothetical protein